MYRIVLNMNTPISLRLNFVMAIQITQGLYPRVPSSLAASPPPPTGGLPPSRFPVYLVPQRSRRQSVASEFAGGYSATRTYS